VQDLASDEEHEHEHEHDEEELDLASEDKGDEELKHEHEEEELDLTILYLPPPPSRQGGHFLSWVPPGPPGGWSGPPPRAPGVPGLFSELGVGFIFPRQRLQLCSGLADITLLSCCRWC
jgi:hypothetical protein